MNNPLAGLVAAMKQTGGRALSIQADSADEQAVTGAVDRAAAELGRLDISVNNAGATGSANSENSARRRWRKR
ncbi:MAG TPA: SDR family NAD(P)-dependent oxidoreductase [Pseudonocardiaceae bacterium]|jgi:3-oxoacyl-[acyl-carrier protein] reductase